MEDYKIVKIGTKKFPIRFGFAALRKFSLKTDTKLTDLDKLGTEMTLDAALQLIYCGIEDGYRKAKQDIEIASVDDLADLIDKDFDAIGRCMEILGEMMSGGIEKKQKAK
jgi:hypothetical protein